MYLFIVFLVGGGCSQQEMRCRDLRLEMAHIEELCLHEKEIQAAEFKNVSSNTGTCTHTTRNIGQFEQDRNESKLGIYLRCV